MVLAAQNKSPLKMLSEITGNPIKKRPRRVRKPSFPRRAEMRYRRILNAFVDRMFELLELELEKQTAVRQDGPTGDVLNLFRVIRNTLSKGNDSMRAANSLEAVFRDADETVSKDVSRQVRQRIGLDIVPPLTGVESDITDAIRKNIAQMRDLQESMLRSIEQEVLSAVSDGVPTADLARIIRDKAKVSKNRAKLIARDQVATMNSLLTKKRQEALGIEKYIWRTSGDERVRPAHAALDGKVFSWDNPPSEGHPGQGIACRCTAEAVIE